MSSRLFSLFLTIVLSSIFTGAQAASEVVIVEGDILAEAAVQDIDRLAGRSIALSDHAQLWADGIVPYTFDPALPQSSVRVITEAIAHWNKVGGITLAPLADVQASRELAIQDSVRFIEGEFCASWVGRRGGQQDVWIAPHCPTGSVMHEIGHLLGLEHEHTRPDRDQFIVIHWDNIIKDKQHNFDAAPSGSRLPGAYDYDSIMHYGSHNCSENGRPTITSIDGVDRGIGQRIAPSTGDLQAVAQLYASDLSVVTQLSQHQPVKQFDVYVSNESAQGAHDVVLEVSTGTSGKTVILASTGWHCRTTDDGANASCRTDRLEGSSVTQISVPLPDDVDVADVHVSISSKTPDLDLSNNASSLQADESRELPAEEPDLRPVLPVIDKTPLQEDAVPQIAVGGSMHPAMLPVLFLLALIGQSRHRINLGIVGRTIFSENRWKLSGR